MDSRIKICIVEDEALIADEIRRTLEGLGYEVSAIYYDYAGAATGLPITDADLFILDINLGGKPDESGIALARLLKKPQPRPFIFLTAYSDTDTIDRATALQPANYLIKPINPAALFAAIQLAIARVQEPHAAVPPTATKPDFFYVKVGTRKTKLYWRDVYCMEASKNYVRVFINGQPGSYPVRGTIAFVLDQLMPEALQEGFFRLSRSVCLHKVHITAIDEEEITCGNRTFENEGRIPAHQFPELLAAGPK